MKALLRSLDDAIPVAEQVMRADVVAIDTETYGDDKVIEKQGLMPWNGQHISGLVVGVNGDGYYMPINHRLGEQADPRALAAVIDALNATRARHLMHHAQFDWAVLEHTLPRDVPGIPPFRHRWNTLDTQTAAWLEDENRPKALKVLGDLYLGGDSADEKRALSALMKRPNQTTWKKHLQAEFPEMPVGKWIMPKARVLARDLGWGDLYPEEIAPYGAQDGVLTQALSEYLTGHTMDETLAREMRVQEVCYRMRQRGVLLDPERLTEAGWEYRAAADAIQEKYPEVDLTKVADVRRWLFEDLRLPVLETTDGGVPSTSKNALEQQMGHPAVEDLLEHRRLLKAINAYVDPLFTYASTSVDGLIHPEFSPVGTVTGRFNCTLPNLQQIPKGSTLPGVRESFMAEPGQEVWEYDLASAELWVGAALTGDPLLTAILREGRDMHTETALRFFGSAEGRWRTVAKNVNYGIPYGAGPRQISRFLAKAGLSPKDAAKMAEEVFEEHQRMFEQYHRTSRNLGRMAKQRGRLPFYTPGRYRHFNSRFGPAPGYVALNSLVQGGVAEVMKDVMIEFERAHPGLLRLQVHDSLVLSMEPGHGRWAEEQLNGILADVNPFSLPLVFEGKQWKR